jgi:acyl-CoA-binding protein
MQEIDLEKRFEKAVALANTMTQAELPQDVQLRLYALYKQATHGNFSENRNYPVYDLRNAFKMNAWIQINHLSKEECKELYIEAIDDLVKKK